MKPTVKIFLVTLALTSSLDVLATQNLQGEPDDTLHAVISRSDPTLIRVDGHRISNIYGTEGEFTATPEGQTGAAYIKPAGDKNSISIFVTDEANQTWQLLLSVSDTPADTIVIASDKKTVSEPVFGRDMERNRAIKYMVLALRSPDQAPEIEVRATNQIVPLWTNALFVLTGTTQGQYSGEKYRLTNTSGRQMIIDERELYRKGVVAVSIDRPVLNPGEVSDVYIIHEGSHE
ncbi:conjugal transfer pilus assembly protein TraK [Nitrosomonas eutropha]|nr:conjugal transfer pilus assembly protein TraK [Nitrosomonas eutropha]